ncbi:RimK family alpha-L-glutamate ligase [Thioalkalivibrio sp. ALJ1]|uniref:ATP-grasp domain-containing protein n=1 Tax=Thioalkalivibrio sp. ALJ1 TaxID=1158144 RepID=UPI0012E00138|nr:hypothetical protein [Thioalkalivibrio sp. ALJ1]
MKIAIQPDAVMHPSGERQSYSEQWERYADQKGVETVRVDVWGPDVLERIRECDAFMWRCMPSLKERSRAAALLHAVEFGLNLPVFPSWNTRWHLEDKALQAQMFEAMDLPHPLTWLFHDRDRALDFVRRANYPFVLKLASGIRSGAVRLVENLQQAERLVDRLFGEGLYWVDLPPSGGINEALRRGRRAIGALRGRNVDAPSDERELHRGYFLAQEFVPNNDFDTRIAVVGNRAFGFRRLNRPDDFRASGSGQVDWDPARIDAELVRMAFDISRRLQAQTVAFDFIRKNGKPLILELTLTYATWAVNRCPGFWWQESADADPVWCDQSVRVEQALFDDFVQGCHPEGGVAQ